MVLFFLLIGTLVFEASGIIQIVKELKEEITYTVLASDLKTPKQTPWKPDSLTVQEVSH